MTGRVFFMFRIHENTAQLTLSSRYNVALATTEPE